MDGFDNNRDPRLGIGTEAQMWAISDPVAGDKFIVFDNDNNQVDALWEYSGTTWCVWG
ncbi:MAG: hypothetical protein ACQ5SW_08390 [Sphaerochaetaceae bacterium]